MVDIVYIGSTIGSTVGSTLASTMVSTLVSTIVSSEYYTNTIPGMIFTIVFVMYKLTSATGFFPSG